MTKTDRTRNTKIIKHFITFLTRCRTQGFDFKQKSYDQLKLIELTRYDFQFESNSSFFRFQLLLIEWFSKFILFMHMHMQDHDKCRSYTFLTQKKRFAKYRWRTYNQWQIVLIPVVSSSGMTYTNVVSIPAENHNRCMTYITSYPTSGARAFNAARIELHML
jgi:hypothetical protein